MSIIGIIVARSHRRLMSKQNRSAAIIIRHSEDDTISQSCLFSPIRLFFLYFIFYVKITTTFSRLSLVTRIFTSLLDVGNFPRFSSSASNFLSIAVDAHKVFIFQKACARSRPCLNKQIKSERIMLFVRMLYDPFAQHFHDGTVNFLTWCDLDSRREIFWIV